jgi:hypothetical protein
MVLSEAADRQTTMHINIVTTSADPGNSLDHKFRWARRTHRLDPPPVNLIADMIMVQTDR